MRAFYITLLVVCFGITTTAYAQPSYNMSTITVTDTAGFLYDDGGPTGNYSNDLVTEFTINVGTGKKLNLQWLAFDVETNEAGLGAACIYDYIEIFDGAPGTVPGTRYCGGTLPDTMSVTNGMITIRFTTDGAGNQKGFKAYWSVSGFLPSPPLAYCDASGPVCVTDLSPHIFTVDVDGLTYTNNTCNDDTVTFLAYTAYLDSIFPMTAGTPAITTVTSSGGTGYEQVDIYIDWNNDGTFDTGTESYLGLPSNLEEATVAIIPPMDASSGYKRMRVRIWDQVFQLGVIGACGSSEYGEVEDYTVFYTNPTNPIPSCASGFSPANAASNVCINTILKWNPATDASAYKLTLKENGGATLLNEELIADTSYDVKTLIIPGKTYTWFVLPTSDNGDALGCDSLTFSTAANPDPVASIIPTTSPIQACISTPFPLDGNPTNGTTPLTHKWSGNGKPFLNDTTIVNPNFTGSTLGTFNLTYTVTDANGCTATDLTIVQVISEANGGTISITGPATVCKDTPVRFKVVGSSGTVVVQDSLPGGAWNNMVTTKINDTIYEVSEAGTGTVFFRTFASGTNCSAAGLNNVSLTVNPSPAVPTVVNLGSNVICDGQTTRLFVTNYSSNITWNDMNATQNDTLIVTKTGDYIATYTGAACPSSSVLYNVTVGPIPLASIDSVGDLTACANNAPTLFTTIIAGETVVWSNGATTKDILATTSGDYFVKVTNSFGCSKTSDTLSINIFALPAKPTITTTGSSNPCEGEPVVLQSSYATGNKWSNGATTPSITVKSSGSFFVKYSNTNGCSSISDTIALLFRPAPIKPTVAVTGKLNTCNGDSVKLSVSTPGVPDWNDASMTVANSIVVYTSGEYFAHYVNSDGCQVYSDTVAVNFTQFQPTPVITLKGSLCEGNTVTLISSLPDGNNWDDAASTKNDSLKVTMDGTYTVTNIQKGVCVAKSDPYVVAFQPRPAQPVITEVGDSLISSVLGSSYQWLSDKGLVPNSNRRSIKPTFGSNYRVIVYSSLGCASPTSDKYNKQFTAIEEISAAGLGIYPNPFSADFTISVEEAGTYTYSIQNQLGQEIQSGDLKQGYNTITTDFSAGVYQVIISTPNGNVSNKLIKQ